MKLGAVRWFFATLPAAAVAVFAYVASEWLFLITMPSSTSALTWQRQVAVLVKAPMPYLLQLLAIQAAVSAASTAGYPRVRALAALPAAIVGGLLGLLLIDNFTYTVFHFGTLTTGELERIVYVVLLTMLMAIAGWKVFEWLKAISLRPRAPAAGAALALVFAAAHAGAHYTPPDQPDSSLLPIVPTAGGRAAPPVRTAPLDPSDAPRPNIIFIGVDGVDAARLSAYGYERPTSPFLEKLRDETLFFENAFSNATRTHGALVTLLTGRLPFNTHVTFPPTALQGEDSRRNLPYLLKPLGYTTLQLALRHYADAEDVHLFGFDAANYRWQNLSDIRPEEAANSETDVFRTAVAERLDERLGHLLLMKPFADTFAQIEGRVVVPQWRDDRRVATLIEYFDQAPEPWFVHLHMLDTHCCLFAPDERRFTGGDVYDDMRDSTFLEADAHIRQLYEALQHSGRLDRTVIVVSSDHASRWLATERVPLMIRFPGAAVKGRVPANVQLADVAPTILDYLKVDIPEWMDGDSLLDADLYDDDRRIVGIADIERREGLAGMRLLLQSGPPNYGVSAAMLIAGRHWFTMKLDDGSITSGEVVGHTRPDAPKIPDEAARRLMLQTLDQAGFAVGGAR